MSDYNGPSEPARVRFNSDWGEFKAGEVYAAIWYPELKGYQVRQPSGGYQSVAPDGHLHWMHKGLVTRVDEVSTNA